MSPDRLWLCLNESLKVYSIPVLTLTFDLHMLPVDNVLRLYMTLYILDIDHTLHNFKHIQHIFPAPERVIKGVY